MALSIGSIATTFVAKTKPFESGVKRASASVKQMGNDVRTAGQRAGAAFKRFGDSVIVQAAKIATAVAAIGFVKMAIGAAATMQQDIITIKAFLGSLEQANALMGKLREFAKTTPFQLKDLVKATKQLLAFGFAQDKVMDSLFIIGNLAAMSGANVSELAQIFGKIKSQGKLMGETLNQLAERGIPVISALADHFGVVESSIRDMVSKGQVSFDDMIAAMDNMAGAGGQFGDLMAQQSKTLAGLWSTLKDNVEALALAFGEKLIPVIRKLLTVGLIAVQWLGNLDKAAIKQILTIGVMIKTLGYMITIFPKVMAGIRALVVSLGVLTAAELAAQAAGMNFAGVAIAIGVIATSGVATMVAFDALGASIQEAENEVNGLIAGNQKLKDSAGGAAAVADVAALNTEAIKTETEAVKELNAELGKTASKPISVAVRGSAAEFSARQKAASALDRFQKAQLKAAELANRHLLSIKNNTEQPLAAAGI
jgi:tape measure domain-containing protein